jgi:hypothetical protein
MPSPYDPRQTVKVGGMLYIQSKNTRLQASPAPTADTVMVLQPTQTVVWLGAVPGEPRWHRVRHGDRTGVVFASNLSIRRPDMMLRPSRCNACNGSGAVPMPTAHQNLCAFETCKACGGNGLPNGRPISATAYASPGVGVKG